MFEDFFPQVKWLVKNSEQFYVKEFEKLSETENPMRFNSSYGIGELCLNEDDEGLMLPRLYFKKYTESRSNPPFYAITTPDDNLLYVGTSAPSNDKSLVSLSVSAMTGGVFPPVDTKEAYARYLAIMFAVKKFGKCKVYGLKTGYEMVKIQCMEDHDDTKYIKELLVKPIYEMLYSKLDHMRMPCINALISDYRIANGVNEIWKCVSAFKLVGNSDIFDEEKKEEDRQVITFSSMTDGFKISFSKKVNFENDCSPLSDSFVASHVEQASKLMKDEKFWKNVETSVNTLDHGKVMSYFDEQYKDCPVPGKDTRVPIARNPKVTKQDEFEAKIKRMFADGVGIRYVNINGSEKSNVFIDGGESSIEFYTKESGPSLIEMQGLIEAVKTAFGIDNSVVQISNGVV